MSATIGFNTGIEVLVVGGMLTFWGGLGLAVIGAAKALMPLARKGARELESSVQRTRTKRIREDLLGYKKLLDEGVLTMDEYQLKTEALKEQIMNE